MSGFGGARSAMAAATWAATLAVAWPARGQILADGREAFTLLDRHLVNRQLFEQIEASDQRFRLGRDLDPLALAADASIGTQQRFDDSPQSRFHGFYELDTFTAARPIYGVDVNLNLVLLNPSASDGYRVSSQLRAGAALHLYYDLEFDERRRARLDLFGTDLGLVTLGRGLLLQQTRGEGEIAGARYEGFHFRQMFMGRAFWNRDDVVSFALGALDGRIEVSFVQWILREPDTEGFYLTDAPATAAGPPRSANYVGASVDWPFTETLRAAAEYSGRVRSGRVRSAALLRGDFLENGLGGAAVHAGYQFRFYERGFGPRGRLDAPTTIDNRPDREDEYVTNPFEYFGISEAFHQWSHTAVLEARVPVPLPVTPRFELVLDGEYLHRFASGGSVPERVVYVPQWGLAPGNFGNFYYRAGIHLLPWQGLPHRLGAFVTNKQVASLTSITTPSPVRFESGTFFLLQVEAFL